ncbi:ATP-binding cassette subfamily B protein [Thermomonospora umbrina]|uniref:ATP-binding cassette subfamily B protein n=2 Tax=Thermomonospora umbrina TaxID=111806 RepID=A0A3D9SLV3_9ACTN|nr:ATP-binding cassette subfamily B protein [Thermomonospora umbrina]
MADTPAWRILLSHVRPHRRVVVLAGVLGLIGGVAGLLQPLAAKMVVDTLDRGDSLWRPLGLLTLVVLGGAVIAALGAYLLGRTAESVVLAARRRLIGRLLRLRVGAVDRAKPGDLMSRVTSDTTLLQTVAGHGIVDGLNGAVILVASIVLMGVMDLLLLGATLAVLVGIGLSMVFVMPRIARANVRVQAAVGEMGSVLERSLGALRTVKASGAEARETEQAGEAAREAWTHGVERARWEAISGVTSWVAVQVAFLVVLGVGGARVASGAMTVSALIAFLLYLFYLTFPIAQVVQAATAWQSGLAAVRRMREVEVLPVEPTDGDAPAGVAAAGGSAAVSFAGVSFRYADDHGDVLRGVTFEVPGAGMTAIVGPSGAGKSTLFALLERFYESAEGVIAVDGRDVREWSLPELRAVIGYVEQDAPIMAGTLRDNLRYAAPAATDEEILDVLARTRLSGLLEQLPDGLDTRVGHRGTTLSGGQRQRVAIARALLRRPRLLLLDEATSQLDAANEMALREAVEDIARTTTVLVIAHRLSTVTSADRIVVIDAGEVRAVGAHAELVEADEMYRDLAATQFITS